MLRVDNGAPWGSCNDLPPPLALWIIGLGIEIHWNTPCRPQENGVIERSQALAIRWAEPKSCQTLQRFQQRINHEDEVQRERYRAIHGQPRTIAYPELKTPRRVFSSCWERSHWDWSRVLQYLSTCVVTRQIDCCGKIGFNGAKMYVGTRHQGLVVHVQLDPDQAVWVVSNSQGAQLRQIPAKLIPEHFRNFEKHRRTSLF